jgi:hypothetical protein
MDLAFVLGFWVWSESVFWMELFECHRPMARVMIQGMVPRMMASSLCVSLLLDGTRPPSIRVNHLFVGIRS